MKDVRKKLGAALLAVAAAAVLGGGIYVVWLRTPPPLPETLDAATALMTSPRYTRLSEQEREPYVERMRTIGESLTDEQKRALWERVQKDPVFRRNAREVQTSVFLNMAKDFAEAEPAKKREILDRLIGMERMASARRGNNARPPGPRPGGDANREERKKWIQDRIEQGNPQKQAYVSEFFKALEARRKELGLPPIHQRPRRG